MIYNHLNSARRATVVDMTKTPPLTLTKVLLVDVGNKTVVRHFISDSFAEELHVFKAIYPIPAFGRPHLFHCY